MNEPKTVTLFSTRMINNKDADGELFRKNNCRIIKTINSSLAKEKWWTFLSEAVKDSLFSVENIQSNITLIKPINPISEEVVPRKITNHYRRAKGAKEIADQKGAQSLLWQSCSELIMQELTKNRAYQEELKYNLVYQLIQTSNNPVYAVHELQSSQKDRIRFLLGLILELTKTADTSAESIAPLNVNLVLHDKDIGGIYERHDYVIIEDRSELENLYGASLPEGLKLRIVFFKHTDNRFVQILRNGSLINQDIHKKVEEAIADYTIINSLSQIIDELPSMGLLNTMEIITGLGIKLDCESLSQQNLKEIDILNMLRNNIQKY